MKFEKSNVARDLVTTQRSNLKRSQRDWITVMRSCRTAVTIILSLYGFLSHHRVALADDADPLVWMKPAEAPAFRDLLSAEVFQERSRVFLEQLGDFSKLAASNIPDHAVRIVGIVPDGQAAPWNLKPGDLITKIDTFDLWGGHLPNWGKSRKVTLYRFADNRTVNVKAEGGRMGIFMGSHWRPELTYLRTTGLRNPKWDHFVVVGAAARDSDPELAEAAWFRAMEAGYLPDGLSWICGAVIAMNQGRTETAADFAYFARELEPRKAKFVSPCALLQVMLANYKFSDAYDLCRQYPQELYDAPDAYQMLTLAHRSRRDEERNIKPPSQLAENYYRNNLLPKCLPVTTIARDDLPKFLEGNGLTANTVNGTVHNLAFLPPVPARDLELKVRFTPLKTHPGSDEPYVTAGFVPCDLKTANESTGVLYKTKIGLTWQESSRITLSHGVVSYVTPTNDVQDSSRQTATREIRLVCVRGQLEGFIDGKRWLYQPVVNQKSGFAAFIMASSTNTKFESIEFNELVER